MRVSKLSGRSCKANKNRAMDYLQARGFKEGSSPDFLVEGILLKQIQEVLGHEQAQLN
jgi:hypothetical protein